MSYETERDMVFELNVRKDVESNEITYIGIIGEGGDEVEITDGVEGCYRDSILNEMGDREEAQIESDILLNIKYDFHEGEKRTRHYPGSPAYAEVWDVRVGDVEVPGSIMSDDEFEELCQDVFESHCGIL